jgi:hypothetical protein
VKKNVGSLAAMCPDRSNGVVLRVYRMFKKIHGITSEMSSAYVDNKSGFINIGPEFHSS